MLLSTVSYGNTSLPSVVSKKRRSEKSFAEKSSRGTPSNSPFATPFSNFVPSLYLYSDVRMSSLRWSIPEMVAVSSENSLQQELPKTEN